MSGKAKRKPSAAKRSTPQIQTDRSTGTPDPEVTKEVDTVEETQQERDAAGEARKNQVFSKKDTVPDYEPERQTLEHEDFDHHLAEKQRQDELQRERDVHNERTGDASLR